MPPKNYKLLIANIPISCLNLVIVLKFERWSPRRGEWATTKHAEQIPNLLALKRWLWNLPDNGVAKFPYSGIRFSVYRLLIWYICTCY